MACAKPTRNHLGREAIRPEVTPILPPLGRAVGVTRGPGLGCLRGQPGPPPPASVRHRTSRRPRPQLPLPYARRPLRSAPARWQPSARVPPPHGGRAAASWPDRSSSCASVVRTVGATKLPYLALRFGSTPKSYARQPSAMTPDSQNNLQVDLEEIAPGEFFIAVRLQNRRIASLYLRGDRQSADEFLEVARRRILLTVTGEEPGDAREMVAQELARLREDAGLPRK